MNHLISSQSLLLSPTRTIVTSFTPRRPITQGIYNNNDTSEYDDGDWVLCLASSSDTIACALSNGCIQIYDAVKLLPLFSTQYFPHNSSSGSAVGEQQNNLSSSKNTDSAAVVTDLIYGPENTIISTATNGVVIVSDLRVPASSSTSTPTTTATTTPNPVIRGWVPESALCLSLGYDNYCVAIGTNKGRIRFIDLRKAGELLGSYVESHTDAITQVKFHDTNKNLLLSGSEDGLMCLFDTKQPTEELALQSVMNVTTSIRKIGFCHSSTHVYCLTGSETMSIWDTNTATCHCHFDHWNLRQNLTNEMNGTSSSSTTTTTTQNSNQTIDYLIDAYWDDGINELQLAAGTNSGDVALYTCTDKQNQVMNHHQQQAQTNVSSSLYWKVNHILHGGHKGVVRAWCPLRLNNNDKSASTVVITAGEDARLCEWNRLGKQLSSRSLFHSNTSCSFSSYQHHSSSSSFDDGWSINRQSNSSSTNHLQSSFSSSISSLNPDRYRHSFSSSSSSSYPSHSTHRIATTKTSTTAAEATTTSTSMDGGVTRTGGGPIRGRNQRRHNKQKLASPY